MGQEIEPLVGWKSSLGWLLGVYDPQLRSLESAREGDWDVFGRSWGSHADRSTFLVRESGEQERISLCGETGQQEIEDRFAKSLCPNWG